MDGSCFLALTRTLEHTPETPINHTKLGLDTTALAVVPHLMVMLSPALQVLPSESWFKCQLPRNLKHDHPDSPFATLRSIPTAEPKAGRC